MSQVTVGGGDSVTCGLRPTLISFMGAGVPHSVPSRRGGSGTATASRPLSRALQRACACSSSCGDQASGAAGAVGRGLVRQHARPLALVAAAQPTATCGPAVAGPAFTGAVFCANAPGAASTQNAAATAKRLPVIKNWPLVPLADPD